MAANQARSKSSAGAGDLSIDRTLCGLRNRTIVVSFSHIKGTAFTSLVIVTDRTELTDQAAASAMDFFFSLMVSPAAFAALVAALYWVYPIALLHGYKRYIQP